jgi:drug/metabolite transporter (DMT)-like permease
VASRASGVILTLFLLQGWGMLLVIALFAVSGETISGSAGLVWAALAGVLGMVSLGCLFLALTRSPMGLVVPFTALLGAGIPAVVGIASGEPTAALTGIGIMVALVAVVVVSMPAPVGATHGARPERKGPLDWLLIVAAGGSAAAWYLTTDRAHEEGLGTISTLLVVRIVSIATIGSAFALTWLRARTRGTHGPRFTRRILGITLVASLADTLGTVSYLNAIAVGALSVTVVLISLHPVATAVLARVVLHERLSRVRIAGVALAVAGAALIGLGEVAAG